MPSIQKHVEDHHSRESNILQCRKLNDMGKKGGKRLMVTCDMRK